jgi:hypothetical protein
MVFVLDKLTGTRSRVEGGKGGKEGKGMGEGYIGHGHNLPAIAREHAPPTSMTPLLALGV